MRTDVFWASRRRVRRRRATKRRCGSRRSRPSSTTSPRSAFASSNGPTLSTVPAPILVLETLGPTRDAPARDRRADASPDLELMALAAAQPSRTMAGTPARQADVINLVFNATGDELSAAFAAAGWNPAVALSLRADARTVLAVAEDRGYKLGPVSLQSWRGQPPDRVFQKQTEYVRPTPSRPHLAHGADARRQARLGRQRDARHRHQVRARRTPVHASRRGRHRSRTAENRRRFCVSPVPSSASRWRGVRGCRRR